MSQVSPSPRTTPVPASECLASDSRPHVVIIGGGFGGLTAAQSLKHAPVRVTLVDKSNHHVF
ncbi:MAG TPA: FAD-dependent oxidoreductase, partial [Blastocatellia bacterium]|nr:FAD-dependent oxidoreductase [Blastocatellia bacterium]